MAARRTGRLWRRRVELLEPRRLLASIAADTTAHDQGHAPYDQDATHLLIGPYLGSRRTSNLSGPSDGGFRGFQSPAAEIDEHGRHVRAADFNGDGIADLAIHSDNLVRVLLSNEAGGLDPPQEFAHPITCSTDNRFVVEDFTADGVPEIVVACGRELSVIGFVDGVPSIAVQRDTAASNARTIATNDFNNDGHLDIAVGGQEFSQDALVLLGNGANDFVEHSIGALGADTRVMATGDVDNDGNVDLVFAMISFVTNEYDDGLWWMRGHGDGSFDEVTKLVNDFRGKRSFLSLNLADLNGDGLTDIVASDYGREIEIWFGSSSGFQKQPVDMPDYVVSVLVTHFGDDVAMVVVTQDTDDIPKSFVHVLRASTGFSLETHPVQQSFLYASNQIQLTDYTGDGVVDIVANTGLYSGEGGKILILPGTTSSRFTADDGVSFGTHGQLYRGHPNPIALDLAGVAGAKAAIDAWIDFDQDGFWSDEEQVFEGLEASATGSSQNASFEVPPEAMLGQTHARVRISSQGGLAPYGAAIDGEVEDYVVEIVSGVAMDFGDAPTAGQTGQLASYPVTVADDGARHLIGGPRFGAAVSPELDGTPNLDAAIEEQQDPSLGIEVSELVVGQAGQISFDVQGQDGFVNAWIDYNRDGSWDDTDESIVRDKLVPAGTIANYYFSVFHSLAGQETFIRARVASTPGLGPTGLAMDGEVDDLKVSVATGTAADDSVELVFGPGQGRLLVYAGEAAVITTLHLNRNPGQTLVISLSSTDEGLLVPSKRGIVFDASNWDIPQQVAWTAPADDAVTDDREVYAQFTWPDPDSMDELVVRWPVDVRIRRPTEQQGTHHITLASMETLPVGSPWVTEFPVSRDVVFYRQVRHGLQSVLIDGGSQWQNPLVPYDVNADQRVSSVDALVIINQMSRRSTQARGDSGLGDPLLALHEFRYYDVNGDGNLTALDALRIINFQGRQSAIGLGEGLWAIDWRHERDDTRMEVVDVDRMFAQLF